MKLKASAWLFVGWLLHYVPFWAMGRVLYFHHYFPALILSSMITGNISTYKSTFKVQCIILGILIAYLLEEIPKYFSEQNARLVYHVVLGLTLSTVMYSFYLFAPLAYGMNGPTANEENSTMYGLKWMDSWEF